jgi:hypothetical protein
MTTLVAEPRHSGPEGWFVVPPWSPRSPQEFKEQPAVANALNHVCAGQSPYPFTTNGLRPRENAPRPTVRRRCGPSVAHENDWHPQGLQGVARCPTGNWSFAPYQLSRLLTDIQSGGHRDRPLRYALRRARLVGS